MQRSPRPNFASRSSPYPPRRLNANCTLTIPTEPTHQLRQRSQRPFRLPSASAHRRQQTFPTPKSPITPVNPGGKCDPTDPTPSSATPEPASYAALLGAGLMTAGLGPQVPQQKIIFKRQRAFPWSRAGLNDRRLVSLTLADPDLGHGYALAHAAGGRKGRRSYRPAVPFPYKNSARRPSLD